MSPTLIHLFDDIFSTLLGILDDIVNTILGEN